MTLQRLAAFLLAGLLLAGCAELKQDVREVRDLLRQLRGREPAPAPPAPPPSAEIPAPAAAGLTFSGNCVGKEETGYAENVRVEVGGGQVRALDGRIDIPGRGNCRYVLPEFRQTRQAPYVELLARDNSACAIRMWQQGDRITLAATDCAQKCTRGAFDYAWPVEFNTAGRCY
jgi:hypothetical protein